VQNNEKVTDADLTKPLDSVNASRPTGKFERNVTKPTSLHVGVAPSNGSRFRSEISFTPSGMYVIYFTDSSLSLDCGM